MADEENITSEAVADDNAESNQNIGNNKYLVKERYEIDYSQPLIWLNNNGANAYKVTDRIDTKRELFALLCNNATAPRSTVLPYIKTIDNSNLMKLIEFGIVNYIPKKSRNLALIYQTPTGGKVFDNNTTSLNLKNNHDKFKSIILSLLSAVGSLKSYNITHRAIRLDNLYYRNEDKIDIILGDCLASFPAFYQPSAYETIENIMSLKEGRGNGNEKNDIYSIGVTMLGLLFEHEIQPDLSAPELLRLKIKKGSYQTLIGDEKISNHFSIILKSFINDDTDARLNYVQAYNLLEGKPSTHSPSNTVERPKRSLTINGEKIYTSRDIAIAMGNSPQEAYELIKSGKIADWIKNGLENDKLATKVEKMLAITPESSNSIDVIVAKTCILISPYLPIKLHDLCLFPDGAPKAIFYALRNNTDTKPFHELFSSDLIKTWYMEQANLRSPANASEFRIYISRQDIGYGLDRIMYDFDDDIPCVSSLLGDEFVNSPTRILRTLDHTYETKTIKSLPFDKSIIAYLRCKMGKKIDGILTDLNSSKEYIQVSAILRLYTNMQNRLGPAQLPNLSKWLANASMPIIKSYHNIKYQKFLERDLLKINKNGKLHELLDILENDEARQKDKVSYTKAVSDVNFLLTEKSKLINNNVKINEEAHDLAIRFATILAVLIMLTSFLFNLIIWALK